MDTSEVGQARPFSPVSNLPLAYALLAFDGAPQSEGARKRADQGHDGLPTCTSSRRLAVKSHLTAIGAAAQGGLDPVARPARSGQGQPDRMVRRAKRVELGLHSAMLAKTLPLLLLCACASTASLPAVDQPELAQIAQPYVQQLQAVGITRVISPGKGAMVLLETGYGPVYVRYPAAAEAYAFVLNIGPEGLQANAPTFDRAGATQILAALVPEAVGATAVSNRLGWLRANPWH